MRRRAVLALASACAFALASAGGCARNAQDSGAFAPDVVPDAFVKPSGALLLPFATRAFEITAAGDLADGAWDVRLQPSADGRAGGAPARIAALDRWRPVLRWTRAAGDVRWEFEAVAFASGPPSRESVLVVSLRARARNEGRAPHAAELLATLAPPRSDAAFVAADASDSLRAPLRWAWPGSADSACGWADAPAQGETYRFTTSLAPGESRETRLLLPAYALPAAALAALARTPHGARVQEALRRADASLREGAAFALGDPEVEDALRAARLLLLACRERRGAHAEPIGGPFQYRDVWLRDGARAAQALALAGHSRAAVDLAAGLAELQWTNGAFVSQRGQLDGTGQALWTFEQVLLRAPHPPPVEESVARGLRAWRWIERQRAGTAGTRYAGLMPYGDPRDGELVRAPLVGTDAWSLAGERALEHLLRASGRSAEADSVAASVAAYSARFRDALARSGAADVAPSWPGGGRDWGNLAVGWPCGALPVGDPRLAAMAARVWASAGGAGLVCYGDADSLHGYVGADLGTWALLAGRRAQADSVLAALLHWRTASGTAAELFSRAGDFGANLPPHPTSAAALVVAVRNAILYDAPDTLRLTLGARERWWRGARVNNAPTWWGPLDVAFSRSEHAARWRWTPVPVWTALTLPPGTRAEGAPSPPLRVGARAEIVLAPPGTREARVRLQPAR